MWVSKTIGANVDLQVKGGTIMDAAIDFVSNGQPYDLSYTGVLVKVFEPGKILPVLSFIEGDGLIKTGNRITFAKQINLATGSYYYELYFNDAVAMGGQFWVRKKAIAAKNIKIGIANAVPLIEATVKVEATDNSDSILKCIAGENLSGGRIVRILNEKAVYYDPDDSSCTGTVLGITRQAALLGDSVEVQISGICYLPGQGFVPGTRYYAGPNGTIVSSANSLIVQSVGHSISTEKLVINFQSPIKTI
jgi:hypothetical protein